MTPPSISEDEANVMRQAIAGMLWSKQFFFPDGDNWLDEHHSNPLHTGYKNARNSDWFHMFNQDVISMPDKWQDPWYAAWDLAFHTLPLSIVDSDFAKEQMRLMLRASYLHPNGQIPAYEWNFSDVNPPVHAFATLFLHRTEQALRGEVDLDFLKADLQQAGAELHLVGQPQGPRRQERVRGRLSRPRQHRRVRPQCPASTGGHLEQADGTAWMALFSQNMLELATELAAHDPTYQDMVFKFVEHFYYIASGMIRTDGRGMWDEEDGFYYDLLQLPDGRFDAAQGALDGGAAAAVRHHGHREMAAGARPAGGATLPAAVAQGARTPSSQCTPPATITLAWPSGASWRWSTRSASAGF